MKNIVTVLALLLMLLAPGVLYGQGALRGVVTDSLTKSPMIGVNVFLVGTGLGSATDVEGQYRILGIPFGKHTLRVSSIGYAPREVQVTISSSAPVQLNFDLSPTVIQGQEVVITAQMRGQVAAINNQVTSRALVNVVSADRIRELPDANAAESIGRLPGISLLRSGGEANRVVIRGMEPKLNTITVNGVKIPSTASNDRTVDLSMIASETLEGIEIFKATTPDMDASSVGGTVNLKIKKAPKEENIQLKLNPGYNQLKDAYGDYKVSAEYSNRFLNSSFGLVTTANYEKINRSSESYKAAYVIKDATALNDDRISIMNSVEDRKRLGASVTIDYAFENGTIWLTNYYSRTARDPFSLQKEYDPGSPAIMYTVEDQKLTLDGLSNALNGELSLWGMDMDWVASRYRVTNNNEYDFTMVLKQGSPFNSTVRAEDNSTYISSATDDITKIELQNNFDRPNKMVQTDYTGQYNLKIPVNVWGPVSGLVKVGGKYSQSDRDNNSIGYGQAQYYLYPSAAQPYYNKPLIMNSNARITSQNFITSPTDYVQVVDKQYKLFPLFNRDVLSDWCEQQRAFYQFDRNSLSESYNLTEKITAGYLMTEFRYGTFLTLTTGARYEYENSRYQSVWTSASEVYGRTGIQKDTTTYRTKDYWFPHVHLKVQIFDGFDLRASVNKTLARPDYYWVSPWTKLDIGNARLYRGNPNLKDTKVWNYNLSVYAYKSAFGFFSLSGYYKELADIFYKRKTQVYKPEEIIALDIPGREAGYEMDTYENTDMTYVRGLEVEWQTQLAYYPGMPELLKGIVLNMNYSRIWSKTSFPFYQFNATLISTRPIKYSYSRTDFTREGPMPGQAEQIANVSLGYDSGPLSARLSFSYQGGSIATVTNSAQTDTWNKEFTRWDSMIKYRFTNWLSVNLNLVNMTNQSDDAFEGSADYLTSMVHYGMTGSAGIEISM